MSAADHPSRYRPPFTVDRPLHPVDAEALAAREAPDLIAGVEFLLGMTGQYQQNEINRAPWRESP